MNKIYDFIIVGGGSSGLVTANKLINKGFKVLVVEEGTRSNNLFFSMPAYWVKRLNGSTHLKFHKSVPQKQLNNRQHDIAQAKILGGGSSVNGMVYMRGKPSDYDKWETATGDKKWNWQSIIKNFIKLENNQRLSGEHHGINGSLNVSFSNYVAKGSELYIKTMQELGVPYNNDFNDGDQYGVGLMQYTIGNNKRCDAVSAFIKPIENNKNLEIKLRSLVTKIIIENKKAIGIEILTDGNIERVFGEEIILTAGSLITPKILMHSGIGDEKILSMYDIPIIENLKGVGKNLQDHHEVPVITHTKPGFGYFGQDRGLKMLLNGLQYVLFKTGPVNSIGVDCCSFINPENLNDPVDPKIKLYCVPFPYTDRDTTGVKQDHGLTLTPCIMNPKSRGEVTITSNNPKDRPAVNPNFLSNQDDLNLILNAVKLARKVIKTKPLSNIIIEESLPGNLIKEDKDLITYCKKMIKTNWHPVGTCKMADDNDEMGVLNTKLQVKGIDKLRVFDVSMMPNIVAANTNAPAMAVADRATDIMLGD